MPNGIKILKMQKKMIRIMTNSGKMDSCRALFKRMKILPLYSQYIYSLLLYMMNNKQLFMDNSKVHNYNTRISNDLHLPTATLTRYQRGAYYSGVKIYNQLPAYITNVDNDTRVFKKTLKRFLLFNSFYSIDEYIEYNKQHNRFTPDV
jgi:hypothetical protein